MSKLADVLNVKIFLRSSQMIETFLMWVSPELRFRNLSLQGYALVEYETLAEAQAAINDASGSTLLEQQLQCDFAFVRPPPSGPKAGVRGRGRRRSASPAGRR